MALEPAARAALAAWAVLARLPRVRRPRRCPLARLVASLARWWRLTRRRVAFP